MTTEPPSEMQRAWEVHKDADSLLHQRMASFLTFEGFLFSAHFILLLQSKYDNIYLCYIYCIITVGIITSILFKMSLGRIISGIKIMKQIIMEADPIYNKYYGPSHVIQYPFASGFPNVILIFWIALLALISVKSGYVSFGLPRDRLISLTAAEALPSKTSATEIGRCTFDLGDPTIKTSCAVSGKASDEKYSIADAVAMVGRPRENKRNVKYKRIKVKKFRKHGQIFSRHSRVLSR